MRYRPGTGTAVLAVAVIGIGLVVALFVMPGGGCRGAGDQCGRVQQPRLADGSGAPVVVATGDPASAGPSTSATPSASATDPGTGDQAGGTGNGGTGDGGSSQFGYGVTIQQPTDQSATDPGDTGVGANLLPGQLAVVPVKGNGSGHLYVDALTGIASGNLDQLLVKDFRGSRSGWTLTATMSDFRSSSGRTIDASNLVWEPYCQSHDGNTYPSTVVAGAPTRGNRTAVLCSAPASDSVTGGQFDVGAQIRMSVPGGGLMSGDYTATLLLTLS